MKISYWVYPQMNLKNTLGVRRTQLKRTLRARVCNEFNISYEDLIGRSRVRNINDARSIYMYLMHKVFGETCVAVAKELNRDHSTIIFACRKVKGFMDVDKEYNQLVQKFI